MFEHDYTLTGKHATYLKQLAKDKDNKDRPYIFDRYIDVYMNAAIFGLLYGRTAAKDNESKDRARVYADAFATERENCTFLYRLAMLIDKTISISPEERVDRAFRVDADEKSKDKLAQNMELFNSYILGGIEVLYEKFRDSLITTDDCITCAYDLMKDFIDEIEGISYEEKLSELMKQL